MFATLSVVELHCDVGTGTRMDKVASVLNAAKTS